MEHTPTTPATFSHEPYGTALVWSTTSSGPGRQIIDEWSRLAHRPAVLRRVNSWDFLPQSVDNLDQLLEMCGFGRPVDDAAGDNMLWNIVRLAEHDDLAARVALHRVMPALMAVARRRGKIMKGGMSAAMSEIVASAWMVIRQFPHERRRHKIASNIVRDAEYFAFVREARLVRVKEVNVENDVLSWLCDGNTESIDEMTIEDLLTAATERGVEQHHIDLLRTLASGVHGTEIAEQWGVSPRTVRNYRRAAIDAVRDAVLVSEEL